VDFHGSYSVSHFSGYQTNCTNRIVGVGQSFTKEVIEAMSLINEVTLDITSLHR
jgi:hypothetical protein